MLRNPCSATFACPVWLCSSGQSGSKCEPAPSTCRHSSRGVSSPAGRWSWTSRSSSRQATRCTRPRTSRSRRPIAGQPTSGYSKPRPEARELTTIAWSWAALLELDLTPEDVFHGTAYKGGDSSNIIDCARRGIYIGFPLLQTWEMAFDEPECTLTAGEAIPAHGQMAPHRRINNAEILRPTRSNPLVGEGGAFAISARQWRAAASAIDRRFPLLSPPEKIYFSTMSPKRATNCSRSRTNVSMVLVSVFYRRIKIALGITVNNAINPRKMISDSGL
jgi:hypothetical protein